MATKFLDAAGLKYAVSKIKTLIAAKQDKLTFDNKPTFGSTNPVTSGGVYDAINNGITISVEPSAGSSTWIEYRRKICMWAEQNRPTNTQFGLKSANRRITAWAF